MSAQLPTLVTNPSHTSTHSAISHETHILKNSNVRVVCRVKPLINEEPIDMKIDRETAEISILQPRQETTKTFTFNRIFTEETQSEFVKEVCGPVIERALTMKQGYLIFSYGVTNSGKTHTILGTHAEPGILPYLVKNLSEHEQVYLSAIELYNDEFFSLVNKEKLVPREQNGFLDFQQCDILEPINENNMESKFKQYINNRTQNETKLNSKSSRSHAIFRIKAGDVIIGVVDLAGSQRTNRVFASIDQTSNINKSLLCLGRCIKALNENPDSHLPIPYRESKLTKVLIEYFAAKVQVLMIANINQSLSCFHENMKVLDYAVLAKDIRHCSTENSLKKSTFKIPRTNKIDVFEALYKSASKSPLAYAHKSLKSSRSKINEQLQKSNIQATAANKKFAKALKAQQLQLYIQKYDSSQETFDYMVEYMHKKEMEDDQKCIEIIKASHYQSPFLPNIKKVQQKGKEVKEVGVGRSSASVELMKKYICEQMREELKVLLEEERLANMEHKETAIGASFSKFCNRSDTDIKFTEPELTPQKSKNPGSQEGNFVMKTSSAIYSSVKKILSQQVHSIKKLIPNFKKGPPSRSKNLTLNNYGQIYESLFKIQQVNEESNTRYSDFSFYDKLPKPKQIVNCETQVSSPELAENKQTQETAIETDDEGDYPSLQIYGQSDMTVVNNTIVERSAEKENLGINEVEEEESKREDDEQEKEEKEEEKETRPKAGRQPKRKANKSKAKEANRVAEMRKFAARLCREQSRTPLKKRLRNYQK